MSKRISNKQGKSRKTAARSVAKISKHTVKYLAFKKFRKLIK